MPEQSGRRYSRQVGITSDVLALIASHRALVAERAEAETKWMLYERDYVLPCFKWAEESGIDLRQLVRDNAGRNCVELLVKTLRAQVRELTEERQQVEQIVGGKYAIGALPIYLQSIVNEYHQLGEAVKSFRERAVRAIRAMSNIEARNESIAFLKGAAWEQDRAASLIESLPLEPEQEEAVAHG